MWWPQLACDARLVSSFGWVGRFSVARRFHHVSKSKIVYPNISFLILRALFMQVRAFANVVSGSIIFRQSLMNSVDGWTPTFSPPSQSALPFAATASLPVRLRHTSIRRSVSVT
jgi:hypothetical protein